MIRSASITLGLLAFAAGSVRAQVPTPKTDDMSSKIIGTWEGPYQSDQASPGTLRLVVGKEADVWKVTLQVQTDQPIDAADVEEFKVDGAQVSWMQGIMGMECRTQATLENGTLKGTTECSQGGAVAITATFLMLKK
ncbi:MAG TPA: hypothetical protein VFU23_03600 [Gemmatimonadales bacterium]|nr:hypothetical protein [Gemmatimonadales bacterium]